MIKKELFGKMPDGKEVYVYTLSNASETSFTVINYGGAIKNIILPDKNGVLRDVIVGFDDLDSYITSDGCQGALIGRVANRIGGGKFTLDGTVYELYKNNGGNTLHGGKIGFNAKYWDAEESDGDEPSVKMMYTSADGEENFPGKLGVSVTYTLTNDGAVSLRYEAVTDKPTIVAMTNHSYFNLCGLDSGVIDDHTLWIDSDRINSVDHGLIPDGSFIPVDGTVYDFREEKRIGDGFADNGWMMKEFLGYDNNFVFSGNDGTVKHRARVYAEKSGITLDCYTDAPCVQIYTANMINTNDPAFKGGVKQYKHCGVCLETQAMPDSINHEGFSNVILRPGEKYDTTTVLAFSHK